MFLTLVAHQHRLHEQFLEGWTKHQHIGDFTNQWYEMYGMEECLDHIPEWSGCIASKFAKLVIDNEIQPAQIPSMITNGLVGFVRRMKKSAEDNGNKWYPSDYLEIVTHLDPEQNAVVELLKSIEDVMKVVFQQVQVCEIWFIGFGKFHLWVFWFLVSRSEETRRVCWERQRTEAKKFQKQFEQTMEK